MEMSRLCPEEMIEYRIENKVREVVFSVIEE